uniref:Immunoglobulin domain-containing protein n=1 Tax=Denticeps clupeoides TaxID=299321 RepID=A0AAY3ZZC4_9TELE
MWKPTQWPLLGGLCTPIPQQLVRKLTPVIGYEGGEVDIRCPYEDKYDKYTKYLCRGECLIGQSIKIEHGQTSAAEGRFSLYDNTTAGSFTVTITGLTAQDSGKYWCGIDRPSWKDLYTELQLKIIVSIHGHSWHLSGTFGTIFLSLITGPLP